MRGDCPQNQKLLSFGGKDTSRTHSKVSHHLKKSVISFHSFVIKKKKYWNISYSILNSLLLIVFKTFMFKFKAL